jgi:hypothetical protein
LARVGRGFVAEKAAPQGRFGQGVFGRKVRPDFQLRSTDGLDV